MNTKALVVLSWFGLSMLIVFRDWSDRQKSLQELTGIWLLSIINLVLAEASDDLGLVLELILVVDVLVQPGKSNTAQTTAAAIGGVLSPTKAGAAPQTTGVVLA